MTCAAILALMLSLVPKTVFSADTMTVILARKSVRNYTGQAIKKEELDILIRAGMAAPTAADKRPWEFIAITERAVLDKMAEALQWGKMLRKAGGAIVVCGMPERSLPGKESEYWIQDCSAATENILLAAESRSLGAVWLGIYPVQERVSLIRSLLKIPKEAVPLNVISIGYPAGTEKPKNKYDKNKIHWEEW